ncbi:MAG: hypothetical protein DWQ04_02955 [Chloroflexi bacterium]|nr:MAG: hypothetical protein DWQ04_02955 [Chloroflexota bacterium]
MNDMVMAIKFNEAVWHDTAYLHPQLRKKVGPDFFDRVQIKSKLKAALRDPQQSLVIFQGERRSGKSSLLRLLENDLEQDANGRFLPLRLSWQSITTRSSMIDEILQSLSFELDVDMPDNTVETCITSDERFINLLRTWGIDAKKTIVVCIDEFDSAIHDGNESERIALLNLVDEMARVTALPVKFLFTLVRRPDCPTSHLLANAHIYRLRPFTPTDLDEMITELMAWQAHLFTATIREQLFQLSGGWPYFAKLLLVCLAEGKPGADWFAAAVEKAIAHPLLEHALNHIYFSHFNEAEKGIMLLLAHQNRHLSAEDVAALTDSQKTAVSQLTNRHYLTCNRQGDVKYRIGLLKKWFPQWIQFEEEVLSHLENA